MGRDLPRSRRRRAVLAGAMLLLVLAVLTGSWLTLKPLDRRFTDADQGTVGDSAVHLGPGTIAGQTFVARHAGLTGVDLWLAPSSTAPLTLTLHLRAEPAASEDLALAAITIPAGTRAGFFRFAFPPQADSLAQYYYAWIEAQVAGASLALGDGASYLDGAAYQDGVPLDAQASFRLVYAPGPVILSLLGAAPRALGLVGAMALLLLLPGWALLAWLGPARHTSWAEKSGLAAGIGLALLPLLVLWTDVAGLRLGALYTWLPASVGLASVAWRARRLQPRKSVQALRGWAHSQALWPDIALILILALIVGTRLIVVRTVEVPLWGDGYQHTMIVQLLVDHGGLFDSWQPYTAIDRFTYHFGFHSAAAGFHWITGLSIPQSVLWSGQLLNALAVLALYPLAVRISGSRWGGVASVLVAGLLSPMPSEYVNWGRYTQLAGQVILPAAAWLTWEVLETTERRWRLAALVAVAVGGLALTHYRVLAFYAVFVVALLPFCLQRKTWRATLLRISAGALGAAILFLPWFLHTFQGAAIQLLGHQLTTMPAQVSAVTRENNAVGNLRRYLAPVLWMALPLGLGWAIWRRLRAPLVIVAWSALMVLAANPAWLGLPGTGAISSFAIVIAAYIPAALLAGFLAAEAVRCLPRQYFAQTLVTLVALTAGLWGAQERLRDVDVASNAYVTRPDVRAADWIRENTPADARFLVNSAPAYGGTSIVGADGGWWLPLLAQRQNTVPPLNYATELSRNSALRQQMEQVARLEGEQGATSPGAITALRVAGVTHVYVGQRQGAVNDGTSATLDIKRLLSSEAYEPVYHQDRVWVLRLLPAGGE